MPGFEVFGKEESKHINDVLESGILMRYNFDALRNNQWKAKEFEQAIQTSLGINHVHLTSSGTTALITAIRALGIKAGDEIIMPTFTFVASFEAILFAGAIPVFADIDKTLTLCPISVEKAITSKTKAIMPVHMCGAMADMDALKSLAKKNNLFLIEDACQATGATFNGQHLGTIGDIGCLSFDFVKTITCGEGGAVMTNNKEVYAICHQYSDHGHDHVGTDRGAEGHPILGLNFRISELNAAIGLAQWGKLDQILQKQRELKFQFKSNLSKNSSIKFRKILDEKGDNASFLSFFLENEKVARKLAQGMKQKGIPCAYWFDNHWHYVKKWDHFKNLKSDKSLYKEQRDLLPNYENQDFSQSDAVLSKTISIPFSLNWTLEKVNEMSADLLEILNSIKN